MAFSSQHELTEWFLDQGLTEDEAEALSEETWIPGALITEKGAQQALEEAMDE